MNCASSSPTPTSTIWPRDATPPRPDRAGGPGFRRRARRDGGDPDRGFPAPCGHRRGVARSRAQRDHRPDGPARRPQVRARLRRRAAAGRPWPRPKPHTSRLAGRDMVAGAHALSELPDEITTPGRGQIRAMVINCGNPVVSGPDGAKLDEALAQLDLLVAIDFVQRESHRHAHWLLPAVHWLERDDLLAFTSNMHDEPYLQYGAKAVEPPPGARQEWRIFVDLAIAMRKPLFGAKGLNGFIKATRRLARLTRQAGARVRAALDRPAGRGHRAKGQRPQDQMARRDGAPARLGAGPAGVRALQGSAAEPTTRRCTPRHRSSCERARELLAEPAPAGAGGLSVPAGEPAQPSFDELVAQRVARSASVRQAQRGGHPPRRRRRARHRRRRPGEGVLPRRRDRTGGVGQRAAAARRGHRRPRLGLTDFRSARRFAAGVLRRQPQPADRRRTR